MSISKDMKYTALYWALRFVETELDVHKKAYNGYEVAVYAEDQAVDSGGRIRCEGLYPLTSHKSFVVLELVDRLLTQGYKAEHITVGGLFDVTLSHDDYLIGITCYAWEDYESGWDGGFADYEVDYTSRLVSGLLERKYDIHADGFDFPSDRDDYKNRINATADFDIVGRELVSYKGKEAVVHVPEGIVSIGASAFWNNTHIREVILPDSLERLGGDCFYYCTNLEKVTIPEKVSVMGNNPFAGCSKLTLSNKSPCFVLENGVLYNRDKTDLIHYTISKPDTLFTIPDTVICIGKHCFFACDHLEKIIIPASVIRMENNPFSGCTKLTVENHSPYYHFENGVIYNRFKTTVIGCLNGTEIDRLVIPDTVTLISRNSFWCCKGIGGIVISKNVNRIGYNPFAGCENLLLESESSLFPCENGIIYNENKTHLLCATNRSVGKSFRVPDGVTHINRGVFSGCVDLERMDLTGVTYIDKSAFTNCVSLTELYIPDTVTYIGEWAFAYCKKLQKVSVSRKTVIDKNAFNECPAEIEWRKT